MVGLRISKKEPIHSVVRHGEGTSADKVAANEFVKQFGEFVESERFIPQQVFIVMKLFWKKMPNKIYIIQEEKSLPGHKPMKDRLTLLFCQWGLQNETFINLPF